MCARKFTPTGTVTLSVELIELDPSDDYASPRRGARIPHLMFRVVCGMHTCVVIVITHVVARWTRAWAWRATHS